MAQPRYRETVTGFSSGSQESRDISTLLQSLETDLKRYQQGVSSLGSSEDGPRTREELAELRESIKEKFNTAQNDITQQRQRASPRDRVALEKLNKQVQQQFSRYKQLIDEHNKRRTTYPLESTTGYDNDYRSEVGSKYYPSQQTVLLDTTQADQREIEAEELRVLERDIVDLNDIFKDVAVMVNEQGEDINAIERNVETAGHKVERGNSQLKKAVELARSNRKLKFCLFGCCIAVAVAIILAVVIAVAVTQSD
ncbi:syntaxin-7-like [Dysidea avara]|uniref:syntaxin-7-like n=1 Tax=Dysidea avara TaxID=196820 RepID=UPI003325F6B1